MLCYVMLRYVTLPPPISDLFGKGEICHYLWSWWQWHLSIITTLSFIVPFINMYGTNNIPSIVAAIVMHSKGVNVWISERSVLSLAYTTYTIVGLTWRSIFFKIANSSLCLYSTGLTLTSLHPIVTWQQREVLSTPGNLQVHDLSHFLLS
jgi:hypothetical protein